MMPTDVFPLLSNTELHYVVLLLLFHYLFFHICILTYVIVPKLIEALSQINIGKVQGEE